MSRKSPFRKQLSGPLTGRAGVSELFSWAKENAVGICVVSNAPRESAEMMLKGLNLYEMVDHLLIGAELPYSKPDPYPYLEAMRMLGINREHALAFEDSGPGIQSASSAQIFTFGIEGALKKRIIRLWRLCSYS